MALEHAKAAIELNYARIYVVGRTKRSFEKYFKDIDSNPVLSLVSGGLDGWFSSAYFNASIIHINAVAIEALKQTTDKLLEQKVERILLEKPGALTIKELMQLKNKASRFESKVIIGYNRRQYASVRKLKELLCNESITSFEFEFTEWADKIDPNDYFNQTLINWIKSNSAHVLDTVFYLVGGFPTKLNAISTGKNKVDWHPSAAIFVGSGLVGNIPFTYNADWTSQGRWKIYIRTPKGKYILEPMETLGFIPKNSVTIQQIEIKMESSKPGLAKQIELFEQNETTEFCSIHDQIEMFSLIKKIQNPLLDVN